MTITLRGYDSVSVGDLPANGDIYFAYSDGHYSNIDAIKKRFRRKPVVSITVDGRPGAQIIDCETGLSTVEQATAWARHEVQSGRRPCIYVEASKWEEVRTSVGARGLTGHVDYWIAHYDGDPTIPAGAVAKQYQGSPGARGAAGTSPGHYDVSSVHLGAFGTGLKPTPLTRAASVATTVLTRHLAKRTHPPRPHAQRRLNQLANQIDRVKDL